ncbi:MAG: DUF3078 domain-containing protein [Flavobacteriales bacterium]|nr:DUF3078 domain-containing protein [Flavobacteriales bacterium]
MKKRSRHIIFFLSLFCFFIGNAQISQLDSLKTELTNAETNKKASEARIKALKAEIEKKLPVILWKKGGFFAANFNQMSFNNWASGGVNAISITTLANLYAKYSKKRTTWDNNLDLAYGMIQNKNQSLRKNEDKIDFLSKFGYLSKLKHTNYAALVNFKSQFAPSYTFDAENVRSPMISTFMAPAFILASIGIDYKPKPYFSVYLSPATGKFTLVTVDNNSIKQSFAVDTNKVLRPEFGALMNIFFQKDIVTNVNLLARASLFNNYTDENKPNRKNIDVNLETMINAKLNKYVTASLFLNWIYDNDIDIKYDEKDDTKVGPRLQFKEVFGIGLSYKFN